MENYFASVFEDVAHECSLTLLKSLIDPDILKKSRFTDYEIFIIKNLASE